MKKYLLLTIFALLFTANSYAQVIQNWLNVYSTNNVGGFPSMTKIDADGNTYSGGTFTTDPNTGGTVPSIIKYGPDGTLLWVSTFGGPTNTLNYFFDLKLDGDGNVFVCGSHAGPPNTNAVDMLTCKYNSDGELIWSSVYSGESNFLDEGYFIHIDIEGNVYSTGTGNFNWDSLEPFQNSSSIIVKYNAEGVQQWVGNYDTPNREDTGSTNTCVVSDNDLNVFVIGRTSSDAADEMFVVKYNSAGDEEWVKTYAGFYENVGLAIDPDNQALFIEDWTFAGWNAEIHKISTETGDVIWDFAYNGADANSPGVDFEIMSDLVMDEQHLYLAFTQKGYSQNDDEYKMVKVSRSTGELIWDFAYHNPSNENLGTNPEEVGASFTKSLARGNNGNFYILGWGMAVNASNLFTQGFDIIEVTNDGQLGCVYSEPNAIPYSISTDTSENVYVGSSMETGNGGFFTIGKYSGWGSCGIAQNVKVQIDSDFGVYPNPTKDVLRFTNLEPNAFVTVYSVIGDILLSKSLRDINDSVNLSSLSAGTYIVKVHCESGAKSIYVMKE